MSALTRITAGLALFALVACGGATGTGGPAERSDRDTASAATTTADIELAKLLPEEIASRGTLTLATDAQYPPNEFVAEDGKTLIGWDIELGEAVAAKLGLEPEWTNIRFDGIIPGLEAGKYDLGIASFSVTEDRLKSVDFVSYFTAPGTGLLVKKGNPAGLGFGDDKLCGTRLAAAKGTIQVDLIKQYSTDCISKGKPGVVDGGQAFAAQNDAVLAVQSNRTDAMLADAPVAAYLAKETGGSLEVAEYDDERATYGIAMTKNRGTLDEAVQRAVMALIADGTYRKILDKWGQGDGAITEPVVNGTS
ncbi:MAG: ABC transporter substrate-binding protein [Haloechinothrix sp.]